MSPRKKDSSDVLSYDQLEKLMRRSTRRLRVHRLWSATHTSQMCKSKSSSSKLQRCRSMQALRYLNSGRAYRGSCSSYQKGSRRISQVDPRGAQGTAHCGAWCRCIRSPGRGRSRCARQRHENHSTGACPDPRHGTTDRRARAFDSGRNRGNAAGDLGKHRSGAEPPLTASSRFPPPPSQTSLHDHNVTDKLFRPGLFPLTVADDLAGAEIQEEVGCGHGLCPLPRKYEQHHPKL